MLETASISSTNQGLEQAPVPPASSAQQIPLSIAILPANTGEQTSPKTTPTSARTSQSSVVRIPSTMNNCNFLSDDEMSCGSDSS